MTWKQFLARLREKFYHAALVTVDVALHIMGAIIAITLFWLIDLYGHFLDPVFFGFVNARYLFQFVDLCIIARFIYSAFREITK